MSLKQKIKYFLTIPEKTSFVLRTEEDRMKLKKSAQFLLQCSANLSAHWRKKSCENRHPVTSQRLVHMEAREERNFSENFLKKYLEDVGNNQLKINSSSSGHSQDVAHRTKEEKAKNRQKVLAYSIETLRRTLHF